MSALQEWYQYVQRESRPARKATAVRARATAAPESGPPEAALPRAGAAADPELTPRVRARRFLAALISGAAAADMPALAAPAPEFGVPELEFERPAVEVPQFSCYLTERPVDPVPWDGDARGWIAAVASVVTAETEPLAPEPERAAPGPPPVVDPPRVPIACTNVRSAAKEGPVADLPASEPDPGRNSIPLPAEVVPRLPKHWEILLSSPGDQVAQHSYKLPFRETRDEMVRRLLDPPLTLEEVARLLAVCPTTVRRYTNRGWLTHFRTPGNQRRFRLSDVLSFLETRAGEIRADAEAEAATAVPATDRTTDRE